MEERNNKLLGDLLRRLAEGDISALNEIAKEIESILRTVGNSYYKNRADVDDAIGDLYLKLCKIAYKFRDNGNAYAWIVKVYENSIKSHLRSRRKEQLFLQENGLDFFSDNGLGEKYIENHLFLREIFDLLTEEERRLVVYYFWCGCSIREVAQVLHKTKSTVDRKLKKLEEKVKDLEKD